MRKFVILLTLACMIMVAASPVFGQQSGTGGEAIEEDDDTTGQGELLAKLADMFGIPLETLAALSEKGYTPGEIWLALEMAKVTGKSLDDMILLADGTEGHGWGVLAQKLDIKPGSDAFAQLKHDLGNPDKPLKPTDGEGKGRADEADRSGQGKGGDGDRKSGK